MSTGAKTDRGSGIVASADARTVLDASISEKEFQRSVVELAQALGYLVWHFPNAIINPCVPDLFMFRDGVLVLAELKTNRKQSKLSVNQARMLLDLDAHGFYCYVWRPSDWESIEHVLKGTG